MTAYTIHITALSCKLKFNAIELKKECVLKKIGLCYWQLLRTYSLILTLIINKLAAVIYKNGSNLLYLDLKKNIMLT